MMRPKIKHRPCSQCSKVLPESAMYPIEGTDDMACIDCIARATAPNPAPTGDEAIRVLVEALELYADRASWGALNQHRTAHRWVSVGVGYGPARRALAAVRGEEA